MSLAYYNEIDPFCREWLHYLMAEGCIMDGIVDDRPIEQVTGDDLREFTQCHFFAGIGTWSFALRSAGWEDKSPVWTGSCPCQPFSSAGSRKGTNDKRHLWPELFRLIRESRPDTFFGEQVASKDGLAWIDLVSSDLEGAGYAVGTVDTCAAGFGAPHIRQRLYFVADTSDIRCEQRRDAAPTEIQGERAEREGQHAQSRHERQLSRRFKGLCRIGDRLADSPRQQQYGCGTAGTRGRGEHSDGSELGNPDDTGSQGRQFGRNGTDQLSTGAAGLVNGFWRDADWIYCRDEKYRAVEPGTFPLAHGAAARVGRLRGYGNALVSPQAQGFIEAYLEVI